MNLTPLKAIRKYCLWCMCGSYKLVRECQTEDCPLYEFRLGKGKGSKLKAIRKRCLDCVCGSRKEVRECNFFPGNPDGVEECPLWLFRMGHNPKRKGIGNKMPYFLKQLKSDKQVLLEKNLDKEKILLK